MSDDAKRVVGSVLAAVVMLAGVMYTLIGGVHARIGGVQGEIRELRNDMREVTTTASTSGCGRSSRSCSRTRRIEAPHARKGRDPIRQFFPVLPDRHILKSTPWPSR